MANNLEEKLLKFPGLVGSSIKRAQRSPYDPTFYPGEATSSDVQDSLLRILEAIGMATPSAAPTISKQQPGSRLRKIVREAAKQPRTLEMESAGGDFFSNPAKIQHFVRQDPNVVEIAWTRPVTSGMRQTVGVRLNDGRIEERTYSVFGNRIDNE